MNRSYETLDAIVVIASLVMVSALGAALVRMSNPDWVFIGWQATSDTGGSYPSSPTPPGGWGGNNQLEIQP